MTDGERADKQDIAEVLVRYATGIDQRDWPLFRTCFTDDVLAEYEGIATWEGVDAITDYMIAAHVDLGTTMHQLANIVVEVDGHTATARSYVDAVLMAPDGNGGVDARAIYDDQLVRTAAGWRIAHRRATLVHIGAIPATSPS